jgi:hypothetical protein
MHHLLVLAFMDAVDALKLDSPTPEEAALMVAASPTEAAKLAPDLIAEALKSAKIWHGQCLKLATSTIKEQPTLSSADRRRFFEHSQKWSKVCAKLADVTP